MLAMHLLGAINQIGERQFDLKQPPVKGTDAFRKQCLGDYRLCWKKGVARKNEAVRFLSSTNRAPKSLQARYDILQFIRAKSRAQVLPRRCQLGSEATYSTHVPPSSSAM